MASKSQQHYDSANTHEESSKDCPRAKTQISKVNLVNDFSW